jgi:hypothetical protein
VLSIKTVAIDSFRSAPKVRKLQDHANPLKHSPQAAHWFYDALANNVDQRFVAIAHQT